MHCVSIDFDGFKRLSKTRCNTDTRLLAFVGPNEAGKSSLLQALVWLTREATTAMDPRDYTRGRDELGEVEDHVVVGGKYELSPADKALVADLKVADEITEFRVERRLDGSRGSEATPTPQRNPASFNHAAHRIDRARKKLASHIDGASRVITGEELEEGEESESPDPASWLDAVTDAIANRESKGWSASLNAQVDDLVKWLEDVAPTSRSGKPRDAALAEALRVVKRVVNSEHPQDAARRLLVPRVPLFVEFTEEHRELTRIHDINDEEARANLAPALLNLVEIADLDVERLWRFIELGVGSSVESTIGEANLRLKEFFSHAWNQSKVTVQFKVDANRLELWLADLEIIGRVTDIEERSDGLLMFVALAAFVASQRLDVPPVLLIDEAETHLHFDAQADLVGVLLKQVQATQVLYTTHSPGCLPADLGTGVRLVQRDKDNLGVSSIHNDFWTNEAPGFAPLLYAMGASAAAFSRCRLAVLAEGAGDMVLLPTLLRSATGLDDLEYQVAPGLANAHAFDMDVEDIAAKVAYLSDGDDEGAKYRSNLKEAGVPPSRVFQLPNGWASEDLVSRPFFIEIVNTLLPKGLNVTEKDLPKGKPIAKALELWLKPKKRNLGHVAIAYGLIAKPDDIVFASGAEALLVNLHKQFIAAFDAKASTPT